MAISKRHLEEICKRGQGEHSCRYLAVDASGWVCTKLTSLKTVLDERVADGRMRSKGDNCEGLPPTDDTN